MKLEVKYVQECTVFYGKCGIALDRQDGWQLELRLEKTGERECWMVNNSAGAALRYNGVDIRTDKLC